MKLLILNEVEQQTLREMGIFHAHPRARIRVQAIVRLGQGLTLQQTADEFHVHLNSIEAWRQRWNKQGRMGLYEGHHTGRRRKWTTEQQEALREFAQTEGGSANSLLRGLAQTADLPPISEEPARRYLHEMQLSYKRYRYSLKKASTGSFRQGRTHNRRTRSTGSHRPMRVAVFRRIRFQSESADPVRLVADRPDARCGTAGPWRTCQCLGCATARRYAAMENTVPADSARRCGRLL